jgi:UDP-3-O-[3-hydroxymyristoyl] N-acetylglucosamine deacetylase
LQNKQKTIQKEVKIQGKGLFTGEDVEIILCPANENSGILFQRIDLPLCPIIPASLDYVLENPRRTSLTKDKASVQMVEHLLSALKGCGIDNILIKIKGPEILSGDGSAKIFVDLIEKAQIKKLKEDRKVFKLKKPVFLSEKDIHIVAIPSDEMHISYTMHYPQSSLLGSQYYSFVLQDEVYKKEISVCRTFSLYEEIKPFLDKGLLKGGGLNNAVVIKDDKVMNPDGLRFKDEMVRHKILDFIGDLALMGVDFSAHIISIKSGHFSNIKFARKLLTNLE